MSNATSGKHYVIAGTLFLVGALAFVAAGALGDRVAFYGVAVAFAGVGIAFIAMAKKAK